jgi:hypothetical protein
MFSVGKITKYWLILFKIEVKKIILFVPMTGKKLINGHILKNSLKTRTCLKHFKNELNFCKEFGSKDKLYCGTYCYYSCNTFSRSESGANVISTLFT